MKNKYRRQFDLCVYFPALNSLLFPSRYTATSVNAAEQKQKSKQEGKATINPHRDSTGGREDEKNFQSIDCYVSEASPLLPSSSLRSFCVARQGLQWARELFPLVNRRVSLSDFQSRERRKLFNFTAMKFHSPNDIATFFSFDWKLCALALRGRAKVQRNNSWWMMDASRSKTERSNFKLQFLHFYLLWTISPELLFQSISLSWLWGRMERSSSTKMIAVELSSSRNPIFSTCSTIQTRESEQQNWLRNFHVAISRGILHQLSRHDQRCRNVTVSCRQCSSSSCVDSFQLTLPWSKFRWQILNFYQWILNNVCGREASQFSVLGNFTFQKTHIDMAEVEHVRKSHKGGRAKRVEVENPISHCSAANKEKSFIETFFFLYSRLACASF